MIVANHNPDWNDVQVLLNTLVLPEGKRTVLEKAQEETERLRDCCESVNLNIIL